MTRLSDEVVGRLRDVATWPELPPERYVVRALLGRGGMGAVFAAYDRHLDRDVAIKVANAPAPGSGLDARLRQESRVLGRLEHPGIVPVHDAGELADGRWYYVMKLVRGQTLKDHVARLTGEAAILGVFERVANTVAFAHASGIIHRDLKPSNIMVGSFGDVLVLDWGVAKILSAAPEAAAAGSSGGARRAALDTTAAGTRIGTPGFMAPEQQRGDADESGPPSDVYSLGAILFWMLTGRPAPDSVELAARDLGAIATPPSRRLRALIVKCLAPDPRDRYAQAAELVSDLERYRAGLPVSAHREGVIERAWHWLGRYRTFILLVAAYLVMRALFAWSQR
jgi:serine/threonine-protein kinase